MSPGPLLLIVGMHRSGTSLLGSLLAACGTAMPGSLIQGDTHNPEGYFERADVTALQEQLLIDLERWWPSPRGMQPLPEAWLESSVGQQALAQLTALLARDLHKGAWAIKDPRSSLLLPMWSAACRQLGIPLHLVLSVRDPTEVSVSLVRRDQAITGMDGWRAQRLWWHHNAAVLRQGCALPLQVVHYSHWFDPDQGLKQLRSLVPGHSTAELSAILARVLNPAHRRSNRQRLPCRLVGAVQHFDRRLRRLAIDPRQRQSLQQWLKRQPDLSAPAPGLRTRFKAFLSRASADRLASHPWGYVAELVAGSQAPSPERQLEHWILHGFAVEELQRFAALPGTKPVAEAWRAGGSAVAIQCRAVGTEAEGLAAWLARCPISGATTIQAVPLGASEASAVALNLADVVPGPQGRADLLQLAQLDRVWDPIPSRVLLLRQLGVKASWIQPRYTGCLEFRG